MLSTLTTLLDVTLVLACVLAIVTAIGLIVGRWLAAAAPASDDWLDAPVLGLSSLLVVLHVLVVAGLRLRWSAWVAVAVVAAIAAAVWRRGALKGLPAAFPRALLPLLATTLLAHAAGMAVAGLAFAGRSWGDQYNYTALAHYLTEYPLGAQPALTSPTALVATQYDDLRIGQSILQGWLAAVLPLQPKTTFEPLILLSPLLTALALVAAGRLLGITRGRYLFAAAGAVAPALATLHLESFLSQALAVPLVLHLSVLLARATTQGTLRAHARVGLVFAAAATVYPEYLPLGIAMIVTSVVASWPVLPGRRRYVVATVAILVAPFALGLARGLSVILAYMNAPMLGALYPHALHGEGIARLWFGDLATLPHMGRLTLAAAAALLVLGAYGLLRLADDWLVHRRRDLAVGPQFGLALCLLGVVALPGAALARGEGYAYQFYKTLMGAGPVLGWSAAFTLWRLLAEHTGPWRQRLVLGGCAGIVAVSALATADMSVAAARPLLPDAEQARRRQTTATMLDASLLEAEARLEALRDADVFLCATDATWNAAHANGWLAYAARRARVHALNPRLNDQHLRSLTGRQQWLPGTAPRPDDPLVTGGRTGWLDTGEQPLKQSLRVPYSIQPWGSRTLGLCSPVLSRFPGEGAVLPVEVEGTEVALVAARPTTALLVFRLDEKSAGVVRAMTETGTVVSRTGREGWSALSLPLQAGSRGLWLDVPRGRQQLTRVQLFDAAASLPTPLVENPNGVERVNDERFFWLGGGEAVVHYFSPVDGRAEVAIDGIFGSSLVNSRRRRLRLRVDDQPATVVETSGAPIRVPASVRAGWGRISLAAIDAPDTVLTGDPRTLLYGVRSFELRLVTPGDRQAAR